MRDSRSDDIAGVVREVCGLSQAAREAVLARLCTDDPEPRRAVDARLRSAGVTGDCPTSDAPDAAATSNTAQHVERFAGFALVREVGRGGMGVVYEAQQASPRR